MAVRIAFKGKRHTFPLPKAKRRGYALAVEADSSHVDIHVRRNDQTEGMATGLLLTCRGNVSLKRVVDMTRTMECSLRVSTDSLHGGVNIVTLLSPEGKTIAQREFFVMPHESPAKIVWDGDRELQPCQAATLSFRTEPPVEGTFSLSVTDSATRERTFDTRTLLTDLLLSSELKGFIPQPSFYFESRDRLHLAALDLLMMVQGWTRYDFDAMAGKAFRPRFPLEKGLAFRGKVSNTHYKPFDRTWWTAFKHPVWVRLDLSTPDKGLVRGEMQASADGCFMFSLPPFHGKGRATIYLNRFPGSVIGEDMAGREGHVHLERKRRDSLLYETSMIEPLNAFPPLAKPYQYYETHLPEDLPESYTQKVGGLRYDPATQTYVLGEVVKRARRKWRRFNPGSPLFSVPVDELFTYISHLQCGITQFGITKNSYAYELRTLLATLGYSGRGIISVDGHQLGGGYEVEGSGYYTYPSTTDTSSLPKGKHPFPAAENFKTCSIFAEVTDRNIIYRPGVYGESLDFIPNVALSSQGRRYHAKPSTVRINYTTENVLPPGHYLPYVECDQILVHGYSQPDEFYSPDYSRQPLPKEGDHRRTLYWNPDVRTDGEGRATVSFFNNATCRTLDISAEGFADDGTPMVYR